jgi:DNA polymerase-3 subunit alpha/error-prone DNA polymerase
VILEYFFNRYGYENVAFVVRCRIQTVLFLEVGKVFGLQEELDHLPKYGCNKAIAWSKSARYGMLLEKYPNQRSMHSCGIIISEEPITNYTPLEMPQRVSNSAFDMHVAEAMVSKFDILSQRGIRHIDDTVNSCQK